MSCSRIATKARTIYTLIATARSLRILTHPEGIALSSRRVTVSTSGLVPEITRLGQDFGGKVGLAISLHAADDDTRTRLMPINKKYPLAVLMEALRAYPLPKRRRITIEYTLVAGKNDIFRMTSNCASSGTVLSNPGEVNGTLNSFTQNTYASSPYCNTGAYNG